MIVINTLIGKAELKLDFAPSIIITDHRTTFDGNGKTLVRNLNTEIEKVESQTKVTFSFHEIQQVNRKPYRLTASAHTEGLKMVYFHGIPTLTAKASECFTTNRHLVAELSKLAEECLPALREAVIKEFCGGVVQRAFAAQHNLRTLEVAAQARYYGKAQAEG